MIQRSQIGRSTEQIEARDARRQNGDARGELRRVERGRAFLYLFSHVITACAALCTAPEKWQARRESNPQPAVLETAALPIELLA